MAIFPRIQTPCPYKGDLSALLEGDICRLCKRQVFDLSEMSDSERIAFIGRCSGPVCVKYRFRSAALAAAATALIAPMAACAKDAAPKAQHSATVDSVLGGLPDPANVEYIEVPTQ